MDYQCSCRIGFKIICIVGTVCMVGYWFYKFAAEDRDIGVVDYESFEESEKIHFPVITFCFENVFLSKQMLETNWKINVTKYMQYLKGDHYDDDYDRINYWNVTIDLNKYFLYGEAQWNNDTSYHNDTLTFTHTENFNGLYPEGEFHKCFEVSSNIHQHRYVKKIILHYNKQALLADTEIDSFDVYFNIHHSGQFLLAPNDPSYLSIQDGVKKSFIWIEDMESLRSRISHSRTCTPQKGDVSYDGMVSREHIIQQGCRPPYLQPHANIPSCNTHEKMNHSVYAFKRVRKKYLPIACERMSKIYWVYEEHNYEHDKNATWSFSITYPDYARVIIQSKEVDIHTLVGNIGGYVGLFLGYALIQIPEMFIFFCDYSRRWWKNRYSPKIKGDNEMATTAMDVGSNLESPKELEAQNSETSLTKHSHIVKSRAWNEMKRNNKSVVEAFKMIDAEIEKIVGEMP